jgi:hypothetical protein
MHMLWLGQQNNPAAQSLFGSPLPAHFPAQHFEFVPGAGLGVGAGVGAGAGLVPAPLVPAHLLHVFGQLPATVPQ